MSLRTAPCLCVVACVRRQHSQVACGGGTSVRLRADGRAAGRQPARVSLRPCASYDAGTPGPTEEDADLAWERAVTRPRVEDGLDVHRRVHALAGKHPGYMHQWRAFCDRQQRSWLDARTEEDEAVLAGAQPGALQHVCRAVLPSEAAPPA